MLRSSGKVENFTNWFYWYWGLNSRFQRRLDPTFLDRFYGLAEDNEGRLVTINENKGGRVREKNEGTRSKKLQSCLVFYPNPASIKVETLQGWWVRLAILQPFYRLLGEKSGAGRRHCGQGEEQVQVLASSLTLLAISFQVFDEGSEWQLGDHRSGHRQVSFL